ncbi:MAG: hypothetical protein KGL39_44835 [Patescibacteria group bacterium]|nr:hypothetical protein [Patescibacteria group bacterium]
MTTEELLALTPFVLPPIIPTNKNANCGAGMIVPVTAAASTPVKVTHGLGRKVQGMIVLANNAGANLTPRLQWGTTLAGGVSTIQQVTIQGDEAMTNCLVFIF